MTADKCGSALHALHALGAEPPRVARKKKDPSDPYDSKFQNNREELREAGNWEYSDFLTIHILLYIILHK